MRFFEIHWRGGVVKFNQYYNQVPRLIARLNAEIQKHGIKVVVHDYEPNALRVAVAASSTRFEKRRFKRFGVMRGTDGLELPCRLK